jgi:3',5'-cyclic-AMP phosphodiesterase
MMKLIQLTDIHLTRPGETIAGRDPNANFARAIDHVLECHVDAEAIFVTGDLSDWGDRDDYVRLKERVDRLPVPVRLCIGNHDDRTTFLSVFPDHADENGFAQGGFALSQGVGITLDTWGADTHAGHFCETRQRWLDAQLGETDGPVWLFMHHNPVPTGVAPMDSIMLQDATAFGEIVAAHRERIAHIFFGHCHMPLSGSFRGVPMSSSRGTNHAGWANFAERKLLSASDLPEAYAVILAEVGSVMVHMVEFGYRGEIRAENSPDYAAWNRATMVR